MQSQSHSPGQGIIQGQSLLEITDIQIQTPCTASLFTKEPLKGFGSVHTRKFLSITSHPRCSCSLNPCPIAGLHRSGLSHSKNVNPHLCGHARGKYLNFSLRHFISPLFVSIIPHQHSSLHLQIFWKTCLVKSSDFFQISIFSGSICFKSSSSFLGERGFHLITESHSLHHLPQEKLGLNETRNELPQNTTEWDKPQNGFKSSNLENLLVCPGL